MKVDIITKAGFIINEVNAICVKHDEESNALFLYQSMRKIIDDKPLIYNEISGFVIYDDKEK